MTLFHLSTLTGKADVCTVLTHHSGKDLTIHPEKAAQKH